jgi:hypothetical protein
MTTQMKTQMENLVTAIPDDNRDGSSKWQQSQMTHQFRTTLDEEVTTGPDGNPYDGPDDNSNDNKDDNTK